MTRKNLSSYTKYFRIKLSHGVGSRWVFPADLATSGRFSSLNGCYCTAEERAHVPVAKRDFQTDRKKNTK